MDNYEDFYCCECVNCIEAWDRRTGEIRKAWCDLTGKRVNEQDPGCRDFKLDEEGEME